MTRQAQRKARSWGVVIFGLFFLLPGLGILVFGPLDTLRLHVVSAGWERVPALLQHVELVTSRGSDSSTYRVAARYQYTYDGRSYQGERVGYDTASDSFRGEHEARASQLRRYMQRDEPIMAWVNPADPQQAFLVRELRWKMLAFMLSFGLVFAAAGGGMITYGAWPVAVHRADQVQAAGAPIYSAQRHAHWLWLVMGAIFLLVSLPIAFQIPAELRAGNHLILAMLLFALAGAGLVWQGLRSRRNFQYYGLIPVELDPDPGQLGGDVGGRIQINTPMRSGNPYRVTLQCLHSRVTGSGKNRSRSESLLWQQEQVPYIESSGGGTVLRFVFQPPADLPYSEPHGDSYHFWRLLLSGPTQPVPLERSYELPVQRGTGRSGVTIPARHLEQQAQESRARAMAQASAQISVRRAGAGWLIHSPFGLHIGMKLGLMLAGVVFAGAATFLIYQALDEGGMLWFMAGVFSLVGYPLLLGGLFMLGRSLQVEARPGLLRSMRFWFGLPLWRRELGLTQAGQLQLKVGTRTSQGTRHTEYFHLVAEQGGRKVRVAEDIAGREAAEALREELVRLLDLR